MKCLFLNSYLRKKKWSIIKFVFLSHANFVSTQSTEYKGEYWTDHPTIKIFWEVFHDLPLEKKKQFLRKYCP